MTRARAPIVTTVLGTRIEAALDDDRERTILFSDLHVPRDGGAVLDALCAVLAHARDHEPANTRVAILGDLFEFWVGPAQLGLGRWGEVADALAATVAAGCSVSVLRGNRDFLLDDRFARRTGVRVVRGGLLARIAGEPTVLLHGDELCLNDVVYQRWKPRLRHPFVRFLARVLPLNVAMRLGGGARKQSRQTSARIDRARFVPVRSAVVDVLAATGATRVVFGHVHTPGQGPIAVVAAEHGAPDRAGEFRVLPAFDEDAAWLESDAATLRFTRAAADDAPRYPRLELAELLAS